MARDVEFNLTADDKTGTALAAAERNFKTTGDRIKKDSQKTGDGIGDNLKRGVEKAAPGMIDKLKGVFLKGGGSGGEILAVGLAASAPLIGATLSAAIIGGAGVGGVIGGVLLASRDPRVKSAGTALGQTLMTQLTESASGFVGPVLQSIAKIEDRFTKMKGRIDSIFSGSSGFLGPLVDGALDGIEGILRGFDKLIQKGKPVIDQLGKAFAIIGDSIGDAFETISGGSDEAATALHLMARGIGAAIEVTGYLIRGLTELFGIISYIPNKALQASDAIGRMVGMEQETTNSSKSAAAATAGLVAATGLVTKNATAAAGPLGTFTDKVNNLASAGRTAFDATTSVGEAVARVTEATKQNGRTLDENTEKGRANRTVLSQLASSLIAKYNAEVTANGEGQRSNSVAQQNRDTFVRLATALTGSRAKALEMASAMGLIPGKKDSDFYLNTHDAEGRAAAARGAINSIKGKTVTVTVAVNWPNGMEAKLRKLARGDFAAGTTWAQTDRQQGQGMSRTGGASPVTVNNSLAVNLDGRPFYDMSVRAAEGVQRDAQWRQRQGAR